MIIYLDQNKWIEIAKIHHGKNKEKIAVQALEVLRKAVAATKVILPLSGIHYMETARISNAGRKYRLGSVMGSLSKGYTIASYRNIVLNECKLALSRYFDNIQETPFKLIGRGIEHAFGESFEHTYPPEIEVLIERSFLTGESPDGEKGPEFRNVKYREEFCEHLRSLPKLKKELPRDKWDDALYAIAMADIIEPLSEVMIHYRISPDKLGKLGVEKLRSLVDAMPSRAVDVHLHRQILKNPSLSPQPGDLEDWAGLGVAVQYCDLVICEGHFADLVQRDKFGTKAEVCTRIEVLTEKLNAYQG